MSAVRRFRKEFVLKSIFKDAPSFEEGVDYYSIGADYSNVDWSISVKRRSNYLDIYVHCEPNAPPDRWSVRTKIEFKVVGSNQNDVIETLECCYEDESVGLGISDFIEWEKMENQYLVSGNLTVEAKVTILETYGLGKEKIRKFDESQDNASDVILIVGKTKFHVLKMYLATQSSFFKSLFIANSSDSIFFNAKFLENPSESKEPKVVLSDVDSNDFHYFLEVLYGESAIDDGNVEDVLFLADKFDAPTVKRRCEEFLLEKSKETFETKRAMATLYHLENWNFTCAISNAKAKTKHFILKHVFQDVPSFKEAVGNYSGIEDHFNVDWFMGVKRRSGRLVCYVHCDPVYPPDGWEIQAKLDLKVVGRNQNDVIKTMEHCYEKSRRCGKYKILNWQNMENEYLVDGNLTVEAKVTILETYGLGKEKVRNFDESQEHVSDVILVVRNTKFHVLKMYLAVQSIFFKALFFGNSLESKESKVRLTGVDPNDFHHFLEVLYGECAIDDSTIEGILMVADKYSTPMVIRKCIDFLLNFSEMILKKKLQLAGKYKLGEVKRRCMSEIKTVADVHSILSDGVNDLDPSITNELLEKIRRSNNQ
ncbi:hypothetical protein B9Z55_007427 [Caenorhabditis nigoni]|uniref:BTB domain-containing protein n=1 Tax=Caenorhabditis nigoni TaxID=1611254 RepID=A0A2G5V9Z2_9PELO|nr:hypothetical protein B9Z55_007427 [Caenorhabditis nigoni]